MQDTSESSSSEPRSSRHYVTPERLLIGVLAIVGLLYLSERFQWFGSLMPKGWAPLGGVAVVASALLLLVGWYAIARLFGLAFQFSLRGLLLLVAVVALSLGWLNVRVQQATRQRAAIVAFERLGGALLYDWQIGTIRGRPPAPEWLQQLLGVDFFSHPNSIQPAAGGDDLFGSEGLQCADDDLVHLRDLDRLEFLALNDTAITNQGLVYVADLTHLESLGLNGTQVTDEGLRHLKDCKNLKSLLLGGTKITDAGLANLQSLPQLEHLGLGNTQITADGLRYLTGRQNLKTLFISGTRLSEADIDRLKQALPNCKVVH